MGGEGKLTWGREVGGGGKGEEGGREGEGGEGKGEKMVC